MGKLFEELKRRKIFRVAAVYAVVAWLLIEIAGEVLPTFNAPQWVNQSIVLVLILGFPLSLVLAWAFEITPDGIRTDVGAPPAGPNTQSTDRKLIYAILGLVLLVAGFQVSDRYIQFDSQTREQSSLSNTGVMRAAINIDDLLFRRFTGVRTQLGISPNGSQLVYGDFPPDGNFQFKIRNLATGESRLLTENASLGTIPEFSPDGQSVSLLASPNVLIVPISGGIPQVVPAENIGGRTFSWLSNDEFLYISGNSIRKKSILTGQDDLFAMEEQASNPSKLHVLPGGTAFLYVDTSQTTALVNYNSANIVVFDTRSNSSKSLISGGYLPRYASSGHIVFLRAGDLWAVPFDPESLDLLGTETKVLEGVDSQPQLGLASYTFSDSGRLIYLSGPEFTNYSRQFTSVDRFGNEVAIDIPTGNLQHPTISSDGSFLALTIVQNDGAQDIWVYDLLRENIYQRTFVGDAGVPVWTSNDEQLAYYRDRGTWITNSDGTGQPEMILDSLTATVRSFSNNDGKLIYEDGSGIGRNIYTLSFQDSSWISSLLIESPFDAHQGAVSPDGHWIAYVSNESGRNEIYVKPYPDTENGLYRISTNGGNEPSWSSNSDELFYLSETTGVLMSVTIDTASGFSPNTPQELGIRFRINLFQRPNYTVSDDGQRFLGSLIRDNDQSAVEIPRPASLSVVENWFEELKRLAPPDTQ